MAESEYFEFYARDPVDGALRRVSRKRRHHKHASGLNGAVIDRAIAINRIRHGLTKPSTTEVNQSRDKPYVGAWHKVAAERQCRFCQRGWDVRPPTRHHVVPQSWFRNGNPGEALRVRSMNDGRNVIPLCRACHDLVDHKDTPTRMEARRQLRVAMTQAEVAHAIELRGRGWLDVNYPVHGG